MNDYELKPCPFCGGEAHLHHTVIPPMTSFVSCMECHASTERIASATYHCSDDLAVDAWNRRADNEQIH